MKKKRAPEYQMTETDLMFLKLALPRGIIKESWYLRVNESCRTFVIAYRYPSYMEDLLYAKLNEMPGVIITLDVTPVNRDKALRDIARSMDELRARGSISQSDGDALNDKYEYQEFQDLHVGISRANEQIISHTLRFLIEAPTPDELKEKVKEIREELSLFGIETYVPQNEMIPEYRTLIAPADTVQQPLPLHGTFARQFPFHHESFMDKSGLYMGSTSSGGQVFLDTTVSEGQRNSYDLFLTGRKGSGKTATMKSMIQHMICCGNRVITLDIENEFTQLAKKLGGKVVSPFRPDSRINILELPRNEEMVDDDTAAVMSAYSSGISRIETFFYQYVPQLTTLEAEELKANLHRLYWNFSITEKTNLTEVLAESFPRITDLLAVIRDQLYVQDLVGKRSYRGSLSENKKTVLENLESYVGSLSTEGVYGSLFDTYSTINIDKEDFVVFDLSQLSEMHERTYNAVFYNVLSIAWQQLPPNRIQNARVTDDLDRKNIAITVPEAHRFLNAENPYGLSFMEKLVRRARKYDAGIWFDSQSARDFMPDASGLNADKIKTIFEMVQYKAILQQDDSSVSAMEVLFPQFTRSELESAVHFLPGSMLLSIGSGVKIRFQKHIPQEDLVTFAGGRERKK